MELTNLLESEKINPVRVKLESPDENYLKISWDSDQGNEIIWTEVKVDETKTVLSGSLQSYCIPKKFDTGRLTQEYFMTPMFNGYFKFQS